MSDYQNLHFETKNPIAYITIDRPKVLNALNMATMDKLRGAERSASYQGTASQLAEKLVLARVSYQGMASAVPYGAE